MVKRAHKQQNEHMMADNGLHLPGAWVTYLDAFGFSAAVRERDDSLINAMFMELANTLTVYKRMVDAAYQFSDSIFIIQRPFPEPKTRISHLLEIIWHLQRTALQRGIAFRGGIAFGPVTISNSGIYGTAIIDAVHIENSLAYPLVALPARHISRADHFLTTRHHTPLGLSVELPTDTIETKTGLLLAHIIEPPLALYKKVARAELHKSLVDGPDYVAPAWAKAIQLLTREEVT